MFKKFTVTAILISLFSICSISYADNDTAEPFVARPGDTESIEETAEPFVARPGDTEPIEDTAEPFVARPVDTESIEEDVDEQSYEVVSYNEEDAFAEVNATSNQKVEKVIALAKKQLGKPYVWGATGPNSYDCSGLTYYCFKKAVGVTLPRVSYQQATVGTKVSLSKLKRGDLVFFGTNKVSHVGIYLGNNEFIHSPKPGDVVKITSTKTSYFKNNALYGRRILGN